MDLTKILDNFLKKTLWLWLPLYAFFDLLKALSERTEKK